jgi:hypothetical protein
VKLSDLRRTIVECVAFRFELPSYILKDLHSSCFTSERDQAGYRSFKEFSGTCYFFVCFTVDI